MMDHKHPWIVEELTNCIDAFGGRQIKLILVIIITICIIAHCALCVIVIRVYQALVTALGDED